MEPIFQIEQLKRIGHFNMDTDHFHDFYEIYYLLSGQRHYYIRNRMYALEAGDLVFINKNHLHRTTGGSRLPHERVLISFDDAYLEPVAPGPGWMNVFEGESFLLRPTAHEQGESPICSRPCWKNRRTVSSGAPNIRDCCCSNC